MTEAKPPLASESCHYYGIDGTPKYSVIGKNGNERPTTIRDARANSWVPSVSTVLQVIAKPGLNVWREEQLLYAALTLPARDGETLTDYAKRVREDAKAQAEKAAERGTALHAAIEQAIKGQEFDMSWSKHCAKVIATLRQHGIDAFSGQPEHSFATEINAMGYGGKVDLWIRDEPLICDFKSKEKIEDGKRLAWDEHALQLSAYAHGLFEVVTSGNRAWKWGPFRALNVFVGVSDCQVRIVEHEIADLQHAFSVFQDVLSIWYKRNHFGPYADTPSRKNNGKYG